MSQAERSVHRISITTRVGPEGCRIRLSGRFDFAAFPEFRAAYRTVPPGTSFVVDFGAVEYVDSAALGMLLLLRDYAGDTGRITLARCRAQPEQVLRIARLDETFEFV